MNTLIFRPVSMVLGMVLMIAATGCGKVSTTETAASEKVTTAANLPMPVEATVELLGFFSNETSNDGEHSSGYTLHLWHQGDVLIGRFAKAAGLIGDSESVYFENGKVVDRQQIAFRGTLEGKAFEFDGGLGKSSVEGKIRFGDQVQPEKIMLPICCEDAPIHKSYGSLEEWRAIWPK